MAAESGLSYTSLGAPDKKAPAPKIINMKTIEPITPPALENQPDKDSPMQEVWEKYKELATGVKNEKPLASGHVMKPGAPMAPTVEPVQKPAQSAGGIAGIIGQYQENKAKRGRMRSVSVNKDSDKNSGENGN